MHDIAIGLILALFEALAIKESERIVGTLSAYFIRSASRASHILPVVATFVAIVSVACFLQVETLLAREALILWVNRVWLSAVFNLA